MHPISRFLVQMLIALLCLAANTVVADETPPSAETPPDVFMLAEEVDVLQVMSDLRLTEKQITSISSRAESLRKRQDDYQKQEEAILKSISDALEKTRDALASGKEVPASAEAVTAPKLKELQQLRQLAVQDFEGTVAACVQLLESGQIREIARSPAAKQRAAQMVQQIRGATEQTWPSVRSELTQELLEVKQFDKYADWSAELKAANELTGDDRDQAVKDFEERKEAEITEMKSEIGQFLDSVRVADARILSIGVNRLTDSLRAQADIRAELLAMMRRILGSPAAETALKARLASVKTDNDKPAGD